METQYSYPLDIQAIHSLNTDVSPVKISNKPQSWFIIFSNETGVLPDHQAAEKYPLHPIGIIPAWGVFTDSVFQTAFFDIEVV